MDNGKTGGLIRRLRREQGLTQLALAERLGVSDKAVSKWERGLGCPDVSLLPALAKVLDVDLEGLLAGEPGGRQAVGGDLRRLAFFVCPRCGGPAVAPAGAALACCGQRLQALAPKAATAEEALDVQYVALENDYFIRSAHPMTRAHHVSFVALLTADGLLLRRLYPEWDIELRLPALAHGRLLWHCTRHGLFWQEV